MENNNLYKYRIYELLNKIPHGIHDQVLRALATKCAVHLATIKRWRGLTISNGKEIPASSLIIIADFFGVRPRDMFNYELGFVTGKDLPGYNFSKQQIPVRSLFVQSAFTRIKTDDQGVTRQSWGVRLEDRTSYKQVAIALSENAFEDLINEMHHSIGTSNEIVINESHSMINYPII